MKTMYLAALAAAALMLGGCAGTMVPTVKAQQTVDTLRSVYKLKLDAENIYLAQTPCGLPGSAAPPLCASYSVGVKLKELDQKLKAAIVKAQDTINKLGDNPTAVNAAIAAANLALAEYETFAAANGVKL